MLHSTYYTGHTSLYCHQAKEWIKSFISLAAVTQRYQKSKVTPYMHVLATHVLKWYNYTETLSNLVAKVRGIHLSNVTIFLTSTGAEKLNVVAKGSYHSSNKWDPTEAIMLTEQRISLSSPLCRKRRAYTKKRHRILE